jgi:hypothetical protein
VNIAPRVIATIRIVVRTEAKIIFIETGIRSASSASAEGRIAQADRNQNDGTPRSEKANSA